LGFSLSGCLLLVEWLLRSVLSGNYCDFIVIQCYYCDLALLAVFGRWIAGRRCLLLALFWLGEYLRENYPVNIR
jgi:hypothetical protein